MRASKMMNSIHQEYVGPRPNRTGNNSELITEYCALHVIHQEYVDHDQTSQKYSYDIVLCTFGAEHRVRNFRFCFFSCVIMTRPSIWTTTKQNWKQLRTHRKCYECIVLTKEYVDHDQTELETSQRSIIIVLCTFGAENDVRNFRFNMRCAIGIGIRELFWSLLAHARAFSLIFLRHSQQHKTMDHSQNYALHFICITFHLHYISFAFKNHATSARNGSLPEYFITFHLHYISFALHYICI